MSKEQFPHDASYKAIFREKIMVKSLLLDFIPDAFVTDFNFDAMELYSPPPSGSLHERRNDLVWKLPWKNVFCYVYLMLEFQSKQDRWMPLRMLTYTSLLWEGMVKSGEVAAGGLLPPIFPIVLYNGDTPWKASVDLADLIMPVTPELGDFQPSHKFRLLDEKRVPESVLQKAHGPAAYVVRTEQAESCGELIDIAVAFDAKMGSGSFSYGSVEILEWMDRKYRLLEREGKNNSQLQEELEESMLIELINKYKKPFVDQGKAEGLAEGKALGFAEGRAEGRAEGVAEGSRLIVWRLLTERFGSLPAALEGAIGSIRDPDRLLTLSSAVYKVRSLDEFEALLRNPG